MLAASYDVRGVVFVGAPTTIVVATSVMKCEVNWYHFQNGRHARYVHTYMERDTAKASILLRLHK